MSKKKPTTIQVLIFLIWIIGWLIATPVIYGEMTKQIEKEETDGRFYLGHELMEL